MCRYVISIFYKHTKLIIDSQFICRRYPKMCFESLVHLLLPLVFSPSNKYLTDAQSCLEVIQVYPPP